MKMRKKAVIAAVAFSAALNLSACAYGPPYDPADNQNMNAYGPPPEEWEYEEDTSINTNSENDDAEESSINE